MSDFESGSAAAQGRLTTEQPASASADPDGFLVDDPHRQHATQEPRFAASDVDDLGTSDDLRTSDEPATNGTTTDPMTTDQQHAGGTSAAMPTTSAAPAAPSAPAPADGRQELLDDGATQSFRGRWRDIQADFVDRPQQAVQEADTLVADLMQQLARTFADERSQLEGQWSRGDEVSTEELRVSLTRYRSFFERLLAV